MAFINKCAVLMLCLAATAKAYSQATDAGPNLEQTVAFINEAFDKLGAFEYMTHFGPSDSHIKYVGPCGFKVTTLKVASQHLEYIAPNTLVYTRKATEELKDTECAVKGKNGEYSLIGNDEITTKDLDKKGKTVTNTTSKPMDETITAPLDVVDPRLFQVKDNTEAMWIITEGSYETRPTKPETFRVVVSSREGEAPFGTFTDKDRALRVAKAYIHAFSMKFVEKKELF